jgi:hypothetical protein
MVPAAVMLTGCVSTQQIAARARLVSARTLASQSATEVVHANRAVTVRAVALIRAVTGTAVVVSLRNHSSRTLTDLPIVVGIHTRHGPRLYLNRSANLDYFESHVAAIGPGAVTFWVFTTSARVSGGRPFVTVGISQLSPSVAARPPAIEGTPRGVATVTVTNRSVIPQYDLPVYVVAVRAGRYVAAGRGAVAHLGTHGTTTLTVSLIGSSHGATLDVIAPPTILS